MTTLTIQKKNTPAAPRPAARPTGLLSGMGDLSALLDVADGAGGPLQLDMRLIDEDPNQPRTKDNPGFSEASLAELAEAIALRGVKTPISVRDNPEIPGRFIINHGARRFRGSKIARKPEIPGFIDNDYNEADQVVENLLRNELTAREIADFIGRELAKGIKKGEIAKSISKSAAFVTQHSNLLDLPEVIAQAFNSGRVNDVTVVNELLTAHKKKPQEVTDWLADEDQEITRGSVKLLREFLDDKSKKPETSGGDEGNQGRPGGAGEDGNEGAGGKKKEQKAGDPEKFKKAIIQVQHNDRPARLLLDRRPPAEGFAWLKYEDDGQEFEANLILVQLVAVLEG